MSFIHEQTHINRYSHLPEIVNHSDYRKWK